MSLFSGLEQIVNKNCPLGKYTWYGLGGKADYLITPSTIDQLKTVVQRCNENNIPMRVLGHGSNILVSDEGITGAVIKLQGDEFTNIEFDGEVVSASAGANLNSLVIECVREGIGGLEALTGIPGSIGGAIKMNAGGTFGDIGTCTESVTLMDNHGDVFEKSKPELAFKYRSVNITAMFILAAKFSLTKTDPDQLLRTVKEVWIYKKNSQPLSTKSAGCVFKNPPGQSAGALIDRAGLKGLQIGGASVSEKHANFIIAGAGCKSSDVKRLLEAVSQRVKEDSDIELELEIELW